MQNSSISTQNPWPRRPRIQIEYDVEIGGAIRKTELPWVTGVMADLSGDNAGILKDIQDRSFADVDEENFDAYLKSQTPRVNIAVENLISGEGSIDVDITFEKLLDFTPDNLVRKVGAKIEEIKLSRVKEGRNEFYHISQSGPMSLQLGESCDSLDKLASADYVGMKIGENTHNLEIDLIPNLKDSSTSVLRIVRKGCLAKLLDARNQLRDLLINVDDKAINSRDIDKILTESPIVEQIANGIESIPTDCPEDIRNQIEQIIAKMECRLESQMNLIIHHEKFQKLEGSWRGLHYMVAATETSDMLKIRVINVSKTELHRAFKGKSVVGWEQTVIFKKIYEEEYGTPGGRPFGVLIGDYEFGPSGLDVQVLRGMSKVASTAHAPFIASASAELLDLQSWKELNDSRDLRKAIDTIYHIAWNSLREDEDSRYIGLAMPRFLSRVPYGEKTNPIETFCFEEDVEANDHTKYCWANAAYAFGTNINRSFYENGWTTQIRGLESGGIVENLPCHVFPADDGGLDAKCPTEIAITDRREKELADIGLIPLSHYKNTDYCCFFGAQSLKRASQYLDAEATHNEALFCRMPYLFAICRIAHYIKCMVRDKVGSFMEASDMQVWLNKWIASYVIDDGDEMAKAHKPLRYARIEVTNIEGNPGLYRAILYLQPHFQLEGLTAPLRLVTTLIQKG